MHELGLLRGVVAAVEKAAHAAGASGVEAVHLRVGALSGTVPEVLLGSWPIAASSTIVDGATLIINPVPAAVWCVNCQGEQTIDEYFAWTCPTCGTPTGQLVSGREFEVMFADLEIPPASQT